MRNFLVALFDHIAASRKAIVSSLAAGVGVLYGLIEATPHHSIGEVSLWGWVGVIILVVTGHQLAYWTKNEG